MRPDGNVTAEPPAGAGAETGRERAGGWAGRGRRSAGALLGLLHLSKNTIVKVSVFTVLPLQKAAMSMWHGPPNVQLVSFAGVTPPPKTHGADGVQNLTLVNGAFAAGP